MSSPLSFAPRGHRILAALLILPGLLLQSARAADDSVGTTPTLQIRFTPEIEHGVAVALHVHEHVEPGAQPLPPLLIPRTMGPLQHIDQRITDLHLYDERGELPVRGADGEALEGLGGIPQAWIPSRPSQGDVTVDYRVSVSDERIPGPTWELRADERGISAAGFTFLLLPQDVRDWNVQVSWDLGPFRSGKDPKGSDLSAIDSLPGPTLNMARLRATYFMAGRPLRLPPLGESAGPFRAASTAATEKFPQDALLQWSQRAYLQFSTLFGEPELPPFTVLFRSNTLTRESGTALPGALLAIMARDSDEFDVQELVAHEMVHVFLHGLDPQSWFQEGLAVTYQDRAPFMVGLFDSRTYIDAVNRTLRAYYANVRRGMPMADAEAAFWTDARARLQPYDRGALYFFVTDGRLRAASDGKRRLDEVLREFLQRRGAGQGVAVSDWLALLRKDIGDQADQDYAALQNGGLLVPDDGAFGACFKREAIRLPQFELGFEISSLMHVPRIIHGLDPASPAARAGLREGDIVINPVGLDAAQGHPDQPMLLVVQRDGHPRNIRFKPVGAMTDGYQWHRRDGAREDSECRN